MKIPFLQQLLANRMAVMGLALLAGIIVARLIYDTVSTHDRKMRPLLIGSVVNLSLLALIWAGENSLQSSGWLAAAITWMPQQWFLPASIVLAIIALRKKNGLCIGINGLAAAFVAVILMGAHLASPPTLAATQSMTVLTLDVDHWKDGAQPTIDAVKLSTPTVVCLQEADNAAAAYKQLRGKLSSYHWVDEDGMTIGSTGSVEERSMSKLMPDDDPASCALVAAAYVKGRAVNVVDYRMTPCDTNRAFRDPAGYFANLTHDRDQESKTLLATAEHLRGAVVLCGDFNAPPQIADARKIDDKFTDAFDQCGTGYGYTSPAKVPVERVDRILLSNGLAATDVSTPVTSSTSHLPVLASIQIPVNMLTARG